MRVMLFEPQFAGHNLVYARHITEALLSHGIQVTLLTSRQAFESDEFRYHWSDISSNVHVLPSDGFKTKEEGRGRGIRVQGPSGLWSSLRVLYQGLRQTNPQHLYIPFGNPLSHVLGLPNPVSSYLRRHRIESEIVLLFGKYSYPHKDFNSRLKQNVALRLLSRGPWRRIHHIVPHAVATMHQFNKRLGQIARLLPDPIDPPPGFSKIDARKQLGLEPSAKFISLVGLVEQRKGIRDLLQAIQQAESLLAADAKVLLAGKQSAEARDILSNDFPLLSQSGRVVSLDRHLSQSELWAACIASDVITTPYPHHPYSASILIRAAAVGVPVLANRIGWMEDVTKNHQLGWICNTRNPEEFAKAISTAFQRADDYRPSKTARDFVEFHSVANFQSLITERLRERLRSSA